MVAFRLALCVLNPSQFKFGDRAKAAKFKKTFDLDFWSWQVTSGENVKGAPIVFRITLHATGYYFDGTGMSVSPPNTGCMHCPSELLRINHSLLQGR